MTLSPRANHFHSMAEAPTPIAEIDHGPSKFEQFLDHHQKKLIVAAILIALGVVAYVVWVGLEEAKQHDAGSALVKADKLADYQDVIKAHPGSHAAATAMPLLADMQWQDSQPDAIKTLQDFLAQHPEHPAAHTASVSLGLRLLEQRKTDDAKEILSAIAESHPDSYIAPLACIALGDIAKAKGELTNAKTWYEKARGDSERGNAFLDMANGRIAIVNAKPPVKIKPAPPKPPAAPPIPAPPAAESAPAANDKPDTDAKPDETPLPAPQLDVPDAPEDKTPADAPDSKKNESQPAPPAASGDEPEPTL